MKLIDIEELIDSLEYDIAVDRDILGYEGLGYAGMEAERRDSLHHSINRAQYAIALLMRQKAIKTKSVKYYDEEENVWKIGEVIVSDSEKSNNSKVSEIPTGSERSSE
jgi:hypothetical protein